MTIEERLTKLERKNRRLTFALLFAGLAAILAVAVGMATPNTVPMEIRAHRFCVVDKDDNMRVELDTMLDQGYLSFCDEGFSSKLMMGTTENGSFILLHDKKGHRQVRLGIGKDGGGMIDVYNPLEKVVASIQANKRNVGAVYLNNVDGSPGNALVADASRAPTPATVGGTSGRALGGDNAIETQIDGTFEGWDGDTIWQMTNGQIWQQASIGVHVAIRVRPKLLIYQDGSQWKMKVEGENQTVAVKRIK
jgi:hypothetical protein